MKVLLTSSGLSNGSIKRAMLELAGKPAEELHTVFMPTAANPEMGSKWWLVDHLQQFKDVNPRGFDVVDIEALSQEEQWRPRLEPADIVVFGGGDMWHLVQYLERSGLMDALPQLMKDKVYVGISAGAIITGPQWPEDVYRELYQQSPPQTLQFVEFYVRPHYQSEHFNFSPLKVLEASAPKLGAPLYVLDDDSAVLVEGERTEVVSEGEWRKLSPA